MYSCTTATEKETIQGERETYSGKIARKKRKRFSPAVNSLQQLPAAIFFFCASPLVLLGLGLGSPEFFSISVAADAGARAWCVSLSRRSCLPILFLSCFSPLSPSILCLVYWCMGNGRWR